MDEGGVFSLGPIVSIFNIILYILLAGVAAWLAFKLVQSLKEKNQRND
ncbi:hypothetical protein LCM20_09755 [Halobacillus litoralis]|nr:hypothetical protein [Halobacillus litoralis]MCA0970874.1 hypothetical protein [Halobacillus litoralis]